MYIGFFEPTVIFFGITNLPAIFQAMMNEILRDLINKEKVAVFVDDVLVDVTNFIQTITPGILDQF